MPHYYGYPPQHRRFQHHQGQSHPSAVPTPHYEHMYRQITIEDAIGIARGQVSGQVVQAELERKAGRLIFEVDIINQQGVKYEVKVDAMTGEVIEVELD